MKSGLNALMKYPYSSKSRISGRSHEIEEFSSGSLEPQLRRIDVGNTKYVTRLRIGHQIEFDQLIEFKENADLEWIETLPTSKISCSHGTG